MLTNIIGTILAFVTIMLMLSLIVTSLVQFTQATLRLRGRNLLIGVGALIERHLPEAATGAKSGESRVLRPRDALKMAAHVLNDANASPLKQVADPNAIHRILMGPTVSWVEPADLARALVRTAERHGVGEAGVAPAPGAPSPEESKRVAQQSIQTQFESMEPALAKRFQFIMRIWTVAWSLVIAIAFQVSTPDLLKSLPSADARREAIIASVPALVTDTQKQLSFADANIVDAALTQLASKYPQYQDLYAEVSGDSDSKDVMIDELGTVLGAVPEREQVLREYSRIIDSLTQQSAKTAIADASNMLNELDSFGIGLWRDENYYFGTSELSGASELNGAVRQRWYQAPHWARIIGVLITGILLSLGAPFWFAQLKNLASLRDSMNPNSAAPAPKSAPK